MATYPRIIKHSSGRRMALRNDLLALRISPQLDKEAFLNQLEDDIGAIPISQDLSQNKQVISGSGFIWVQPNGSISEEFPLDLNQTLIDKYPNEITNISPVYRLDNFEATESSTTLVSNMLLIRFSDHLGQDDITNLSGNLEEFDLYFDKSASAYQGKFNIFRTKSSQTDLFSVKEILEKEIDGIRDVDFNYQPIYKTDHYKPQDPEYASQWNMWQIAAGEDYASSTPSTTGWDITTGNSSIIIAVIDTGVVLSHPDLASNMASTGFLVDGDGNIYTDLSPVPVDIAHAHILPYITASNGSALLNNSFATELHGTKVTGIIAAGVDNTDAFGNYIGLAGLAGGCKILPIADLGESSASLNAAINKAVDEGARIINISRGDWAWQTIYLDATICEVVGEKNVVICASTGNADADHPETSIDYPALHTHVLACGASTQPSNPGNLESKKSDSRYLDNGNPANGVSVVAPGVNIRTTIFRVTSTGTDLYDNFGQTSAAVPHASALAALMLSKNPNLTAFEVRDIMEQCAERVNPGAYIYSTVSNFSNGTWNEQMGHGRINVLHSLNAVPDPPDPPDPKTIFEDAVVDFPLDRDLVIYKTKEHKELSKDTIEVDQLKDAVQPLNFNIEDIQDRLTKLENSKGLGEAFIDPVERPEVNPDSKKQ